MRAADLFKSGVKTYRKSINPPYRRKDLISILGTLVILIAIPLTVLLAKQGEDFRSKAATPAEPLNKKVLLLIFNPTLESKSGSPKLTVYRGWSDPDTLSQKLKADVSEVTNGLVTYTIAERIEVDGYPTKTDGFTYTDATYLQCLNDHSACHNPDMISYNKLFQDYNIAQKMTDQGISEVWLWGAPYFGPDEYAMKIPGNAPYNNPNCRLSAAYWFYRPYDIPDTGKTVWVMGFSYERGEGEMLESYGHRVEGVLSIEIAGCVWTSIGTDPWSKYTWINKNMLGQAQCGGVHYGPNSLTDYDWSNSTSVPSACDDWYNYPNLPGTYISTNCSAWGCDMVGHHKWWLGHLPRASGVTGGKLNNWWGYIVDYDNARSSKPGDLNSDNKVDILDLSILLTNWGATSGVADINKDGLVNILDLSILLSHWET